MPGQAPCVLPTVRAAAPYLEPAGSGRTPEPWVPSALPSTVLGVNDHVGELVERNDGFAYDYRMKCDCGGSSVLTAADYFAEVNQAHMHCEHCGRTIHFGQAVIALRDCRFPV
jgi:hypothetical protein